MKPVFQTKFGSKDGNCWPAVIASILEIPQNQLDRIPNFCSEYQDWVKATNDWLEPYGFYTMIVQTKTIEGTPFIPFGFHGIGGKGPRGTDHACVGYRGELIHDPFPGQPGLVEIEYFDLFIPYDPTQGLIRK